MVVSYRVTTQTYYTLIFTNKNDNNKNYIVLDWALQTTNGSDVVTFKDNDKWKVSYTSLSGNTSTSQDAQVTITMPSHTDISIIKPREIYGFIIDSTDSWQPTASVWMRESQIFSLELSDETGTGAYGGIGIVFDVKAKRNLMITGFDIHFESHDGTPDHSFAIYVKSSAVEDAYDDIYNDQISTQADSNGHFPPTDSAWTEHQIVDLYKDGTEYVNINTSGYTRIDCNPISLTANQTYGIYLSGRPNNGDYTINTNNFYYYVGNQQQNDDLIFEKGWGIDNRNPDSPYGPVRINRNIVLDGRIYYK